MQKHVWWCLLSISGLKSISIFKISIWLSIFLNAIRISSGNYAKYIFCSYVFHLLSGCTSQKVLIVNLTKYKQIFLKLVAPSIKVFLIMILHYCHFKSGKPDRARTICRYLIKRLWQVWFLCFYLVSAIVVQNKYGLLSSFKTT